MKRTPTAIAGTKSQIVVIASDGSMWTLTEKSEWARVKDLPEPHESKVSDLHLPAADPKKLNGNNHPTIKEIIGEGLNKRMPTLRKKHIHQMRHLFINGATRQEVANITGYAYSTVCLHLRENLNFGDKRLHEYARKKKQGA